jgi:flagellar biosynthesis protein FliR
MSDISIRLMVFALVLTRLSAFFLILPVFGSGSIPVQIKAAIILLLSAFFMWIIPPPAISGQISDIQAVLLISIEAVYGLALGLISTIVFSAVKLGAEIVDQQMGFSMAEIIDPVTGEATQPLGSLFEIIFILLFLSANGHHLFLKIISQSFVAFPAGSIPSVATLTGGIVQAGTVMMTAGLKIAAPMLAAFIILMIVLAVLARMVPEMNILFISLPLQVGMGLLMMAIFVPYISPFISEFAAVMDKLLPL